MSRFALPAVLALFSIVGCGDPAPQCVIDTDCPFGQRCQSDRTCQPIGAQSDSGSSRDGGGMTDAAPVDAAMVSDSSVGDAAIDAAADDAAAEDAAPADLDSGVAP